MADGVRTLCRVAAPLGLRISLECVPYSGLPTLDYVRSILQAVGVIDRRRLMPGSGELPLHDLLAAVLENSPDAYIEVEVLNDAFNALPADDQAARLAEHTRTWLAAA